MGVLTLTDPLRERGRTQKPKIIQRVLPFVIVLPGIPFVFGAITGVVPVPLVLDVQEILPIGGKAGEREEPHLGRLSGLLHGKQTGWSIPLLPFRLILWGRLVFSGL